MPGIRWLVVLALTACGPGEPPAAATTDVAATEDVTSTPTTGDPGEDSTSTGAACLEFEKPWTGEFPPHWQLGCDAPTLCPGEAPLVVFLEGEWNDPTSVEIEEPERARCFIKALAGRTFGQFDFSPVVDGSPDSLSLEILGDLAVARSAPGGCKLSFPSPCRDREALRVLRPPGFFEDCVEGDARALWLCLSDALEPLPACGTGPLACPDAP
jgi:hypothetical protein